MNKYGRKVLKSLVIGGAIATGVALTSNGAKAAELEDNQAVVAEVAAEPSTGEENTETKVATSEIVEGENTVAEVTVTAVSVSEAQVAEEAAPASLESTPSTGSIADEIPEEIISTGSVSEADMMRYDRNIRDIEYTYNDLQDNINALDAYIEKVKTDLANGTLTEEQANEMLTKAEAERKACQENAQKLSEKNDAFDNEIKGAEEEFAGLADEYNPIVELTGYDVMVQDIMAITDSAERLKKLNETIEMVEKELSQIQNGTTEAYQRLYNEIAELQKAVDEEEAKLKEQGLDSFDEYNEKRYRNLAEEAFYTALLDALKEYEENGDADGDIKAEVIRLIQEKADENNRFLQEINEKLAELEQQAQPYYEALEAAKVQEQENNAKLAALKEDMKNALNNADAAAEEKAIDEREGYIKAFDEAYANYKQIESDNWKVLIKSSEQNQEYQRLKNDIESERTLLSDIEYYKGIIEETLNNVVNAISAIDIKQFFEEKISACEELEENNISLYDKYEDYLDAYEMLDSMDFEKHDLGILYQKLSSGYSYFLNYAKKYRVVLTAQEMIAPCRIDVEECVAAADSLYQDLSNTIEEHKEEISNKPVVETHTEVIDYTNTIQFNILAKVNNVVQKVAVAIEQKVTAKVTVCTEIVKNAVGNTVINITRQTVSIVATAITNIKVSVSDAKITVAALINLTISLFKFW